MLAFGHCLRPAAGISLQCATLAREWMTILRTQWWRICLCRRQDVYLSIWWVQSTFHLISKQCGLRHRWYRMQGLACFQRRSALHLGFWRAFLLKRFWTSCGFILCSRRWAGVFWAWPTCRDLLDSGRELLTAEDLLHEGWPSQASDALWMSATTDSPQWRCSRANRHVSCLNRRARERVSCTPFTTQSPKSRSGCIVPVLLCCSNLPLQRLNWLMRERKQLWHTLSYRHTVIPWQWKLSEDGKERDSHSSNIYKGKNKVEIPSQKF